MLVAVVAVSSNNVIGRDNDLVFDIKKQLRRFKEVTSSGSAIIIMGRKTFESLPNALPDRHHIILTNNKDYVPKYTNESVEIVTDINEVIQKYADSKEEVFVIGGGTIYEALMPYTKKLCITFVNKEAYGDTFFPNFDKSLFDVIYQSEELYSKVEDCTFYYLDYLKK